MASCGKLDKIALRRTEKWFKIKYIPRAGGGDSKKAAGECGEDSYFLRKRR